MSLTKETGLHNAPLLLANSTPQTDEHSAAVRKQLKRILASPPFNTSKRYPALLQYVVEATLKGQAEKLKERSLGIEVFHRDPLYDTSTDPVVRFAAGEVRKRLAQYYYDPSHAQELHIELPSGCYVPEFHIPCSGNSELEPQAVPRSNSLDGLAIAKGSQQFFPEPTIPPSKWGRREYTLLILCLLFGVAIGAVGVHLGPWISPSASDRFWGPFLGSSNSVLLCVGQHFAVRTEMKPNAARSPLGQIPEEQAALKSNRASLGLGVPGPPSQDGQVPKEVPVLALANAKTLANVVGVLQSKNQTYSIQGESETTFSDLSAGPTVLIGAYDNDWTIRLADQLRFHFEEDADQKEEWIADQEKPSEQIGLKESGHHGEQDYAIISRFYDPSTEKMAIVLAGIGGNGTLAAGEFISNHIYLDEFAKQAPRNWDRRNIQIVIKVDIVDGKTGPPHVVASYFW